MTWRALLDGTEAARAAREASDAIARDLVTWESTRADLGGAGGAALFLAYHAAAFDDAESDAAATRCLDRAIGGLASHPLPFGLFDGFTGIAWVTEHLAGAEGEDDPNAEIDRALATALARDPLDVTYDLISGVTGACVYALERLPRPAAVSSIERIVDHLARTAHVLPEGTAWFTEPRWLPSDARRGAPDGYYNAGVAHGVPGVIAVLARVVRAGIAVARARPLLDGAVAWVLAQRTDSPQRSQLPVWIVPGHPPTPSRSAWCYGDPGIAIVLLAAGRMLGEPAWVAAGHELLRALARRPAAACNVVDAGFCHGALGLAHLLARGYAATADDELRLAALAWYERGLAMRSPAEGIGGFFTHRMREDGTTGNVADPTLLGGAAGIGLALVAALSPAEPLWDRLWLADIPD